MIGFFFTCRFLRSKDGMVGRLALLLGSGLSSEVGGVVPPARKYKIHLTISFSYVSLRTRILGQAPFLNRK
jgi:hypothetical protein